MILSFSDLHLRIWIMMILPSSDLHLRIWRILPSSHLRIWILMILPFSHLKIWRRQKKEKKNAKSINASSVGESWLAAVSIFFWSIQIQFRVLTYPGYNLHFFDRLSVCKFRSLQQLEGQLSRKWNQRDCWQHPQSSRRQSRNSASTGSFRVSWNDWARLIDIKFGIWSRQSHCKPKSNQ